jgi:TrmH family RNA methyltransferase
MSLSKARQSLLERLRRRHQRDREGCFVVEGVRGAATALHARAPVRFAVVSPRLEELDPGGEIPLLLAAAGVDVTEIDDTELAGLADTVNPQGVLLVCEEPAATLQTLTALLASRPGRQAPTRGDQAPAAKPSPALPKTPGFLIADAIQDPANLGTMIRTSAALGLAGVIALDGTVDPWNAKVVRGTAGACFYIPIVRARCDEVLPWVRENGMRLFGAAAEGVDIREIEPSAGGAGSRAPWMLAVGNEGAGLRDEVRVAADQLVAVPIDGDIDSLNAAVAAAILMWELLR